MLEVGLHPGQVGCPLAGHRQHGGVDVGTGAVVARARPAGSRPGRCRSRRRAPGSRAAPARRTGSPRRGRLHRWPRGHRTGPRSRVHRPRPWRRSSGSRDAPSMACVDLDRSESGVRPPAVGHVRRRGAGVHHAGRGRPARSTREVLDREGSAAERLGQHRPGDRRAARRDPGGQPGASSRRSAGCSPRWACTRSGSTTCATPTRRRCRSCRRRSGPVDRDELARNPFRVFTSVLVPEDRRFFDADLQARVQRFVDRADAVPAGAAGAGRPARSADGGLSPADCRALPRPGDRRVRAVVGADRPGLVRRAVRGLRRRRRHRRRGDARTSTT